MYTPLSGAKPIPTVAAGSDPDISPTLAELTKKIHFFRFLQKEINTVKTKAEKEAVHTILMKTKIQIRALEREWKEIQTLQRPVQPTPNAHGIYATQRIQ